MSTNENEETTSQTHEELEANEPSHEQETEVRDSSGSSESSSGGEEDSVSQLESRLREAEEKVTRYKAERDRLKNKKGGSEEGQVASDDRYERLELKMDGISDPKAQDAVIDYAKYKGISVTEAAKSPAMRAELKQMSQVAATPASSTRTGQASSPDPVETFKKTKKMPSDPEAYQKVYNYLRKRDENKSRLPS